MIEYAPSSAMTIAPTRFCDESRTAGALAELARGSKADGPASETLHKTGPLRNGAFDPERKWSHAARGSGDEPRYQFGG